ncbi:DNA methyltransferase, partial [bacterium (candidate division B38) B3_B38]
GFGNKKTWDTDFRTLFLKFNNEISHKIFSNGLKHKGMCMDIMDIKNRDFDLVYLDPPYIRQDKRSPKDYYSMYHFLEGLVNYNRWRYMIDWKTKNKRLIKENRIWDNNNFEENLNILFKRFQYSMIVLSYGDPGCPSIQKIKELLYKYKSIINIIKTPYKYKLNNKNDQKVYEVLIIGK